jgi:hypothetical protein
LTATVAPDSTGDRNPSYSTSKLRLFRLTVQSDKMSMTWWDIGRTASSETLGSLVRDVTKLMLRKELERAEFTQELFICSCRDDATGTQLADLLNNVHPHCVWAKFLVENGKIVSYTRRSKLDGAEFEYDTLEHVSSPTDMYAYWYKWLLDNPSIHSLCITAPSDYIWRDALLKSGVSVPRRIAQWLFRIIHHKQVQ